MILRSARQLDLRTDLAVLPSVHFFQAKSRIESPLVQTYVIRCFVYSFGHTRTVKLLPQFHCLPLMTPIVKKLMNSCFIHMRCENEIIVAG